MTLTPQKGGANMHTYEVGYSFHGPRHQDGYSTVRANDSAEAERIVRKKFSGREVWIVYVRQRD